MSNLKFWQSGTQFTLLANLVDEVTDLLLALMQNVVAEQLDAERCTVAMLDLLAYEAGITRLADEGEELYRLRVKYAYQNYVDGGECAGFARIFERLGLGSIIQTERADSEDWDVVRLQVDEAIFSNYVNLFDTLVATYGRTCRRYMLESSADPVGLAVASFNFDCEFDHHTVVAEIGA